MVDQPLYIDNGTGPLRNPELTDAEFNAGVEELRQASIPSTISMRQCQLYLYDAGLLSGVESIVASLSPKAQIEWRTSAEVWRSSPMVEQMRLMFGWTVGQMEQMFIDAARM